MGTYTSSYKGRGGKAERVDNTTREKGADADAEADAADRPTSLAVDGMCDCTCCCVCDCKSFDECVCSVSTSCCCLSLLLLLLLLLGRLVSLSGHVLGEGSAGCQGVAESYLDSKSGGSLRGMGKGGEGEEVSISKK